MTTFGIAEHHDTEIALCYARLDLLERVGAFYVTYAEFASDPKRFLNYVLDGMEVLRQERDDEHQRIAFWCVSKKFDRLPEGADIPVYRYKINHSKKLGAEMPEVTWTRIV